MPSFTRALAVGSAAVCLGITAACGGSSSSAPGGDKPSTASVDSWAGNVCTALQSWAGVLSKQPAALQSPNASLQPADAKGELSKYLDGVVVATDSMISNIKGAGAPSIDNGGAIETDLVNGLEPVLSAFKDAKTKVDALPVDDLPAFQMQLTAVGTSLGSAGDAAKKSFDQISQKYKTPSLDQAFTTQTACKGLK